MRAIKVIKRTAGTALAATAIAVEHNKSSPQCSKKTEFICKPSELPIYPVECAACASEKKQSSPPVEESSIEKTIGAVRRELWSVNNEVQNIRQRSWEVIETGIAHASSSVDFLREESNGPERYAAISVASLSGFILGLRGGLFRRLTYATAGGAAMASVCFPREAADYADAACEQAGHYLVAGYHFAFGELPKKPEWLESIIDKLSKLRKNDTEKPK